jgi:hypothetical protein
LQNTWHLCSIPEASLDLSGGSFTLCSWPPPTHSCKQRESAPRFSFHLPYPCVLPLRISPAVLPLCVVSDCSLRLWRHSQSARSESRLRGLEKKDLFPRRMFRGEDCKARGKWSILGTTRWFCSRPFTNAGLATPYTPSCVGFFITISWRCRTFIPTPFST